MNVLYLVHRIPYPPDKGDKLRSFRQLEHLARRHRVWCACFVDDPADGCHVGVVRRHCEDVLAINLGWLRTRLQGLAGLLRGKTISESAYRHEAMRAVLGRWCETTRFDAVVAFSAGVAPYAFLVPARRRVLDLCDLDSRKWLDYADASRGPRRWLYRLEGRRLAERERLWLGAFDATILITHAEADPLLGGAFDHRIHVVENGVDLPERQPCPRESRASSSSPPTVGFVGQMDYRPNIDAVRWFASACWPAIRRAMPNAVFRIVGRRPTWSVRRLRRVPGVEVVGAVDQLGPELQRLDVSVAPMRIARGLQNKVLEAMAWGKPVVLTQAALEGIDARHDREVIVADRPQQIAAAVQELLSDPALRARLGDSARDYVARHHRWKSILRRFELIVTGVGEQRSAPVVMASAAQTRDQTTPAVPD